MADQLQLDYQLRAVLGQTINLVAGTEYVIYGTPHKYMGTDLIHQQATRLMNDHPDLFNASVALGMMRDPLGYRPPPFQLSPNVVAGLAAASAVGKLADLAGMGKAISDLAPGLSSAMEGLTGQMGSLMKSLPFTKLGAIGLTLPGNILATKAILTAAIGGPFSAIAMAMKGSLLADVVKAAESAAGALGAAVNLASQVGGLAKAMSSGNPVAMAGVAAGIASQFPMINPNAIAGQMISGALSGAGFDIASKIPNMSMVGGIMNMLHIPGKLPTKDAPKPIKTAAPPKPLKPVELKNLFAEGAAAGSISDLTKPLSQLMGIAATVAGAVGVASMVAHSAAATSSGRQKLTGNANTVNWGSNGYTRDPYVDAITARRMALSSSIERHTKELNVMTADPYNILYSLPYSELVRRYPQIRPNTPVAQALQFIKTAQTVALLAGITVDIVSSIGSYNFESGGVIDSGAAKSSTSTTPALLDDAYGSLREPTLQDRTNPATFRGAQVPNPQAPYDSSVGEAGIYGRGGGHLTGESFELTKSQREQQFGLPEPVTGAVSEFDVGALRYDDPQAWVETVENKITEEVVSGKSFSASDGYDSYTGSEGNYDYSDQQGDNSVGEPYPDYSE